MRSTNLVALIIGLVAVVGLIYVVAVNNDNDNDLPPGEMGVIGNVVEGVSDKIDQGQAEMEAEANKQSAEGHFDAAGEQLGIDTSDSPSNP